MKQTTELGNQDFFNPYLSGEDWQGPSQEAEAATRPRRCGGRAVGAAASAPSSGPAPEALLDLRVDLSSITAPKLQKQSLPTAAGSDWKFWTVNFRNGIMNVRCSTL